MEMLQGMIRKRSGREEEEEEFYEPNRKRRLMSEDDDDENMLCRTIITSLASSKKERMARNPNMVRDNQWWSNKYHNSSPGEFKIPRGLKEIHLIKFYASFNLSYRKKANKFQQNTH